MKNGFVALCMMCGLFGCASMSEPETPASVPPTKRGPQREQLPPAPSNTPVIVYARAVHAPLMRHLHVDVAW